MIIKLSNNDLQYLVYSHIYRLFMRIHHGCPMGMFHLSSPSVLRLWRSVAQSGVLHGRILCSLACELKLKTLVDWFAQYLAFLLGQLSFEVGILGF